MMVSDDKTKSELTPEARLRRVALLCLHTLRNLAYYRSVWRKLVAREHLQFWVHANSNSLDMAVMEWCKVFADRRGRHRWQLVVSDAAAFEMGLLRALRMSQGEFAAYLKTMLDYRDKFIAHLDEKDTMHIPTMRPARVSAAYLMRHLRREDKMNVLFDAPDPAKFYSFFFREGVRVYRFAKGD